jgi:microcystin-dependent protein
VIADTAPRVTHNCNGSLEEFSFSFPLTESSDLVVTILNTETNESTILAETTGYDVADTDGVTGVLADFANGGTITTLAVTPYSADYRITLERQVPYTQEADFTEGMPTLYQSFEQALDKLTMELQQIKDKINRSPYCPAIDSTSLSMELPNAANRANRYLGFDSNGEPTVTALAATEVAISAYGETLVAATDAAEVRTMLDIDTTIATALLTAIPAGSLMHWPTETPPAGWLIRNGQSLVRADYPALFAVIGTMYGAADITHFNLPNDLGMFIRGWANSSANDPDRASRTKPSATGATLTAGDHVGTEQDHAAEAHLHSVSITSGTESADHYHSVSIYTGVETAAHQHYVPTYAGGANNSDTVQMGLAGYGPYAGELTGTETANHQHLVSGNTGYKSGNHTHTVSGNTGQSTGNETRPINRAYLPIIKA